MTGVTVAKDLEGNLAQREKVLARAEADEEFQAELHGLCARSPLLWLNLFGWTFVTIEQSHDGRRGLEEGRLEPFITWVCQDLLLARWHQAVANGETLLVPKSREMGASWLFIADSVHRCQFAKKFQARVLSRKEDLVDGIDNPDTLLWKADCLVKHQPDWMRPVMYRRHLVRSFPDTGGTIIGEATSDYSGAGGRGGILLVDEAAQVDNLLAIDRTTRDTAGARAYITTSRQGTGFSAIRRSGRYPEHGLWWWDHPVKGDGRELVTDEETGEQRYTSPWYEAETTDRDRRDIGENLMGEDSDASAVIFSNKTIEIQIHRYGRDPVARGFLELPPGALIDPAAPGSTWPLQRVRWRDDGARGPWRLWCSLVKDAAGRLRPRQDHALVLGGDVGRGTGASNSDLAVWDAETGDKIARLTSSRLSPSQLADAIFIAGHWFGGRLGVPFAVIEANGAGTETLIRLR
ncbi:MAG TPA: hypothetical protein VFF65_02110, partial [Phycisphaerales bacterium]|nr:hypothetical protein [Phycisphaerales bacterium]